MFSLTFDNLVIHLIRGWLFSKKMKNKKRIAWSKFYIESITICTHPHCLFLPCRIIYIDQFRGCIYAISLCIYFDLKYHKTKLEVHESPRWTFHLRLHSHELVSAKGFQTGVLREIKRTSRYQLTLKMIHLCLSILTRLACWSSKSESDTFIWSWQRLSYR